MARRRRRPKKMGLGMKVIPVPKVKLGLKSVKKVKPKVKF